MGGLHGLTAVPLLGLEGMTLMDALSARLDRCLHWEPLAGFAPRLMEVEHGPTLIPQPGLAVQL